MKITDWDSLSNNTRSTTDIHLYTRTPSTLKMHMHMAHINRSMDTCLLLQIGLIRSVAQFLSVFIIPSLHDQGHICEH